MFYWYRPSLMCETSRRGGSFVYCLFFHVVIGGGDPVSSQGRCRNGQCLVLDGDPFSNLSVVQPHWFPCCIGMDHENDNHSANH